MDDIDAESEELGGQRTFFAGDFARYGWPQLVRAGLGGHETLNLYAEAITPTDDSYMVASEMMVIIVSDLYTKPLKMARSAKWARIVPRRRLSGEEGDMRRWSVAERIQGWESWGQKLRKVRS